MNTKNPFKNTHIEFHILQSFPVTCLNRDDVGSPKTALVGGTTRARVSSQCWKRQVRMEMNQLGVISGHRTKLIGSLIAEACLKEGATEEQARICGEKIEAIFIKQKESKKPAKKSKDDQDAEQEDSNVENEDSSNNTLIFISPGEVLTLAKAFKEADFVPEKVIKQKETKKQAKEIEDLLGDRLEAMNAIDVALFGRMVALAPKLNVEAATSFAHAISTHKVSNEVEFFSALDDMPETPGAGHIGSLEFNSATYYRYVSLDLGQLWETLKGIDFNKAVDAFTKALFVAIPSARQNSMSGSSQWDFAKILIRKGQRLQLSFDKPVRQKNGYLEASIEELKNELSIKEKRAGSLFGKQAEFTFGESEFSIDNLTDELYKYIKGNQNHAE